MGGLRPQTVFRLDPAPGFVTWRLGDDLPVNFEEIRWQDWQPVGAVRTGNATVHSDVAAVAGAPGCFVIPAQGQGNDQLAFFAVYNGSILPLSGAAGGYVLFRPEIGRMLDEDASIGLGDEEVERYAFWPQRLGAGLFRSMPRTQDVFFYQDPVDAGQVTDLIDFAQMDFKTWYELSGATGLIFTKVWEHRTGGT